MNRPCARLFPWALLLAFPACSGVDDPFEGDDAGEPDAGEPSARGGSDGVRGGSAGKKHRGGTAGAGDEEGGTAGTGTGGSDEPDAGMGGSEDPSGGTSTSGASGSCSRGTGATSGSCGHGGSGGAGASSGASGNGGVGGSAAMGGGAGATTGGSDCGGMAGAGMGGAGMAGAGMAGGGMAGGGMAGGGMAGGGMAGGGGAAGLTVVAVFDAFSCSRAHFFEVISVENAAGEPVSGATCEWTFDDGGTAGDCAGTYEFSSAGPHRASVLVRHAASGAVGADETMQINVVDPIALSVTAEAPTCGLSFSYVTTKTGGRTGGLTAVDVRPFENVLTPGPLPASGTVEVSAPGVYTINVSREEETAGPICLASASTTVTLTACP